MNVRIHHLIGVVVLLGASTHAGVGPCEVPDDGSGTAAFPPACEMGDIMRPYVVLNGLPLGSRIDINARLTNVFVFMEGPGGSLGGEFQQFSAVQLMHMTGSGALAGYNRDLGITMQCETHIGPRTLGAPLQSFPTDMFMMQGQLPPGDPDFDLLRIRAGTLFGMPSPGQATLAQIPGGNWAVDSFFDITYTIDFVGAPGGALSGMSGSTSGTVRMQIGPVGPIQPGLDKWRTVDPTTMHFGDYWPPIPANFFYPGSQPFIGTLYLKGLAIEPSIDSADTVIRRLDTASLPFDGAVDTIPIELVALSLVSVQPIVVGPRQYDVFMSLAPEALSPGSMTITRNNDNGGTFAAHLQVKPVFVFRDTFDGSTVELNGLAPIPMNWTAPTTWEVGPPSAASVPGMPWYPAFSASQLQAPNGSMHTIVPAQPSSVKIDAWETCGSCPSTDSIDVPPIPADFFAPGSEPFIGIICYSGEPLGVTPFGVFATADTLVRRLSDPFLPFDPPGPTEVVPIEIIAMNLVSIDPITVTYNNGPSELWDVRITLSQAPPSPPVGSMAVTKTHANGGTFDSTFYVRPVFTFTQVDNPLNVRVYDTGAIDLPVIVFLANDVPWVHDVDPSLNVFDAGPTNFHPGIEEPPQESLSQTLESMPMQAANARHTLCPVVVAPPCPGDVNHNGVVDIDDLLLVINNWGGGPGNPADIDADGDVDIDDLLAVINAWGGCE